MFDKWINHDIEKVINNCNRLVVVNQYAHRDRVQKILPTEHRVFVVNNAAGALPLLQIRQHDLMLSVINR